MIHKSKIKLFSGYRTQWCTEMPMEDGHALIDEAKYERKLWPTLAAAEAYAKTIIAKHNGGEFGCVTIDEFRYVPDDHFTSLYDFELVGSDTIEITRD